jgi:hypothetical protein
MYIYLAPNSSRPITRQAKLFGNPYKDSANYGKNTSLVIDEDIQDTLAPRVQQYTDGYIELVTACT